jgi:hypothetical protein
MLKTYRIIPLVFILFLFGFTLITVAPVFAQTEGTRIPKMRGLLMDGGIMGRSSATHAPSRQVIQSNARIAELEAENARLLEQQRASADQSGGEVAQLNARIVESESQVATLTTTNAQLQEQLRSARSQIEALVAKTSELEVKFATPRDAEQVVEEICLSNLPLWSQYSKLQIKTRGKWTKSAIFSALTDQCTPRNARQKLQHILEDQKRLSGR